MRRLCNTCDRMTAKGNTCDDELDLLWSPRLYHRALDVSMILSPQRVETDITYSRPKQPTTAFVLTVKKGCSVDRSATGAETGAWQCVKENLGKGPVLDLLTGASHHKGRQGDHGVSLSRQTTVGRKPDKPSSPLKTQ